MLYFFFHKLVYLARCVNKFERAVSIVEFNTQNAKIEVISEIAWFEKWNASLHLFPYPIYLNISATRKDTPPMYKEIRITSMEQLLALTADQPFDHRNKRYRGYYLYRGLPDSSFLLKTSLQRNCGKLSNMLEPKILANFSKISRNIQQQSQKLRRILSGNGWFSASTTAFPPVC